MIDTLDTESQELPEPSSQGSEEVLEQKAEQPSVLDLDSVDKFKFNGREWTPKDLKSAYMMQSDYSRKMQEISQDRKYTDNLSQDVSAVIANPALVEEFKKIYPQKYHSVLDKILEKASPKQGLERPGSPDPVFVNRLDRLEKQIFEREVMAAEAEIDSKFKGFNEKYPYADEQVVIAQAQAILDKGEQINDKAFDTLFKQSHEKNQTRLEQIYSKKVGEQKKANSIAKDMGSGGGTLGKAPTKFKSIQEATSALAREYEKQ